MTPEVSTLRMRLSAYVVMKRLPAESTATPAGVDNPVNTVVFGPLTGTSITDDKLIDVTGNTTLNGGASISNGTLATGGSELVIWLAGQSNNTNTISAQITGSGGLTVAGGLHVQGDLVVGEAAADLGGLILGRRALHSLPAADGAAAQAYSSDQQYFMAYAHSWAGQMRPEHAQEMVTTDPHPPEEFRANGTLVNDPEFQAAFAIPDSSPMVKGERCVIW